MSANFSYKQTFQRNIGIFTEEQQDRIKNYKIAIAGLGGVGGILIERLIRLGMENFHVADPDFFEPTNLNRQIYSNMSNLNKNKAEAIVEELIKINPDACIKIFENGVRSDNVSTFTDVDLVVDAIEYNLIYFLYLLHKTSRENNKTVLAAQAIGYGATLFAFDPKGIAFEEYIGLKNPEEMLPEEVNNYRIPLEKFCPKLPSYIHEDLAIRVHQREIYIPSCSLGVMAAASLLEMEIINRALGFQKMKSVPHYAEIDFYNLLSGH
jgi:molybdopterin/thiamine biosynthesis adenylyltransferase